MKNKFFEKLELVLVAASGSSKVCVCLIDTSESKKDFKNIKFENLIVIKLSLKTLSYKMKKKIYSLVVI